MTYKAEGLSLSDEVWLFENNYLSRQCPQEVHSLPSCAASSSCLFQLLVLFNNHILCSWPTFPSFNRNPTLKLFSCHEIWPGFEGQPPRNSCHDQELEDFLRLWICITECQFVKWYLEPSVRVSQTSSPTSFTKTPFIINVLRYQAWPYRHPTTNLRKIHDVDDLYILQRYRLRLKMAAKDSKWRLDCHSFVNDLHTKSSIMSPVHLVPPSPLLCQSSNNGTPFIHRKERRGNWEPSIVSVVSRTWHSCVASSWSLRKSLCWWCTQRKERKSLSIISETETMTPKR